MKVHLISLLIVFSCTNLECKRLKLKNLVRHSCSNSVGSNAPIILPKSSETVIFPDEKESGCYTMSGPVKVTRHVGGSLQIYVLTQYGDTGSIVPCRNHSADNCGGVGSCVYCDSCGSRKDPHSGSSVQLEVIGRQLNCREGLDAGEYTDLGIMFCLPNVDDYLRVLRISRDKWNKYYKNKGHTILQKFYIFNEPINLLNKDGINKAIATRRNLIGCDAVVCDVEED